MLARVNDPSSLVVMVYRSGHVTVLAGSKTA
jgi:hypothetical protein